jgi:hypothetical protein
MTFLVFGAVLAACALLVLVDRFVLSPSALVTPEDVVAPEGRPLTLQATVERDILPLWDPPLAGVDVTFRSEGRILGVARTDERGVARLTLPAPAGPGRMRVVADIAGPLAAPEAPFLVDTLPPDREVAVVDIDGTVADVHPRWQGLRDNRKIHPLAGAVESVRALSERFAVVFLTARDHIFRAKTRDWLREHGFPDAPVLMRRGKRYWNQSSESHKRERLSELAVPLRIGVGDAPGDAAAYAGSGMRAYLLGGARFAGAFSVQGWREIMDDLAKAPAQT